MNQNSNDITIKALNQGFAIVKNDDDSISLIDKEGNKSAGYDIETISQTDDLTSLFVGNSARALDSTDQPGPTNDDAGLVIYTDGGSRGNPGPSAAGYVIMDKDENILEEGGEYLGITTNNQAEYQAVKIALEAAIKYQVKNVKFKIDSLLVVNQMIGKYKIKNRDLWPIYSAIKAMIETNYHKVTFNHVYREYNKLADQKVNEVLDARKA